MRAPFSFVKSAGGVFTPATLAHSGLWLPTFAGSPWTGSASAGASSGRSISQATTPPTVGAGGTFINGIAPAVFNGSTQFLAGGLGMSSYFTTGAGSMWALIFPTFASADSGAAAFYLNPAIFSDDVDGFTSMHFSTSGVGFGSYNGVNFNSVYQACGLSAAHLAQARWNSTTIEVRVDSGSWVTSSRTVQLSTGAFRVGRNYDVGYYAGRKYCGGTAQIRFSDTDFDNIKSWVNTTFALAL